MAIYSYNKSQLDALFLNIILLKNSYLHVLLYHIAAMVLYSSLVLLY